MQIAHACRAAARVLPCGRCRTDVAPPGRWHPAHPSSELVHAYKVDFPARSKARAVAVGCQLAVAIERLGAGVTARQ